MFIVLTPYSTLRKYHDAWVVLGTHMAFYVTKYTFACSGKASGWIDPVYFAVVDESAGIG